MQPNSMSLDGRNRQGTNGLKGTKKGNKRKMEYDEKGRDIYTHIG